MTLYLLAALILLLLAAAAAAAYRVVDEDGGAPAAPPPGDEDWHPHLPSRPYATDQDATPRAAPLSPDGYRKSERTRYG